MFHQVLSEDRGLGKCMTLQVAFFFVSCTPRMPLFFYFCILMICLGFLFGVFFCAFLTLSSLLFSEFHFFPNNLRLKSQVLDHLIVLLDAESLNCNVRLVSFSVHKLTGM